MAAPYTSLSVTATPGRRHAFLPKELLTAINVIESVIGFMEAIGSVSGLMEEVFEVNSNDLMVELEIVSRRR